MREPELFDGLRPPSPPEDLRNRVLGAAGTEPGVVQTSIWVRARSHRGLRLAWGMTLAGLLGAHLALSLGSVRSESPTATVPRPAFASLRGSDASEVWLSSSVVAPYPLDLDALVENPQRLLFGGLRR